eukprot:Pgem_evm1s9382
MTTIDIRTSSDDPVSNNVSEEILNDFIKHCSNIEQHWDSIYKDYSTLVETRVKESARLNEIIEKYNALKQNVHKIFTEQFRNGTTNYPTVNLDINSIQSNGKVVNAVELCIEDQNLTFLRKVLKNGANPNVSFVINKGGDDKPVASSLHQAVKLGNVAIIRSLIKYGADFSTYDNDGNTPLHVAIALENRMVINALIKNIAFINLVNQEGFSPLAFAEKLNKGSKVQQDIVDALQSLGAKSIKPEVCSQCTTLEKSVKLGHSHCLKILCNSETDVNTILVNDKQTLLSFASEEGQLECVKELILANADVNDYGKSNKGPLLWAAEKGHVNCLTELIKAKAEVDKVNQANKSTPLHEAAYEGHVDCLNELINAKAEVNKCTTGGCTPLYFSAQEGKEDCLKKLISVGADINKAAADEQTSLHIAAENGHESCLNALIKAGADLDKVDWEGSTALGLAAVEGNLVCVKNLITAGADPSIKDDDGNTALMLAELYDKQECLDFLKNVPMNNERRCSEGSEVQQDVVDALQSLGDKSIKPEACSQCTTLEKSVAIGHARCLKILCNSETDVKKILVNDEQTLLSFASEEGQLECVKELILANADVNDYGKSDSGPLFLAAANGHVNCLTELIKAKAEVDKVNQANKSTSLHVAAFIGHVDCLDELINGKAEVNKCTTGGCTPLYFSAQEGKEDCLKKLISAGADINKAAADGQTPLHAATNNGHESCLNALIKAGADLDKVNWEGLTPLGLAAVKGNLICVKNLITAGADPSIKDKDGDTALMITDLYDKQECLDFLKNTPMNNKRRRSNDIEVNDHGPAKRNKL